MTVSGLHDAAIRVMTTPARRTVSACLLADRAEDFMRIKSLRKRELTSPLLTIEWRRVSAALSVPHRWLAGSVDSSTGLDTRRQIISGHYRLDSCFFRDEEKVKLEAAKRCVPEGGLNFDWRGKNIGWSGKTMLLLAESDGSSTGWYTGSFATAMAMRVRLHSAFAGPFSPAPDGRDKGRIVKVGNGVKPSEMVYVWEAALRCPTAPVDFVVTNMTASPSRAKSIQPEAATWVYWKRGFPLRAPENHFIDGKNNALADLDWLVEYGPIKFMRIK